MKNCYNCIHHKMCIIADNKNVACKFHDYKFTPVLQHIASINGGFTIKTKVVEEVGELLQALTKQDLQNITEEIADVENVLRQLKYNLQIEKQVDEIRVQKIERQLKRFEERTAKG